MESQRGGVHAHGRYACQPVAQETRSERREWLATRRDLSARLSAGTGLSPAIAAVAWRRATGSFGKHGDVCSRSRGMQECFGERRIPEATGDNRSETASMQASRSAQTPFDSRPPTRGVAHVYQEQAHGRPEKVRRGRRRRPQRRPDPRHPVRRPDALPTLQVAFVDAAQPAPDADVDAIAGASRRAITLAATANAQLALTSIGTTDDSGSSDVNAHLRDERARWLAQTRAARGIAGVEPDVAAGANAADIHQRGAHLRATLRTPAQ